MRGINRVILLGRLGKDPDVKILANGTVLATISIATSESWKDKQTGEKQQKTEWHKVVIFGRLAEVAEQYLKKGSLIYIEGQLQTRKWQDQSGNDCYSTEILVGSTGTLQMLGHRREKEEKDDLCDRDREYVADRKYGKDHQERFDQKERFKPMRSSIENAKALIDENWDDVPF